MKILSIDPGAKRCGFAILEGDGKSEPMYHGSGIYGLDRKSEDDKLEKFQSYRLRLIPFWIDNTKRLLEQFTPDYVVSEVVPAVGGGNFIAATQSELAKTVQTVIQTIAYQAKLDNKQISALTVKRQIGGVKDATKPKVRDGVFSLLPHMKSVYQTSRKNSVWDEIDAVAIGLCELGYKV